MKTITTFILLGILHAQAGAFQTIAEASETSARLNAGQDTVYYVVVENMPQPIGGIQTIQQNVHYPEIMRRAGIEGTVYVEAFIDETGTVIRTGIVKGVHPALDKAAADAITKTKFEPGQRQGKPVKVRVSIPIRFRMSVKGEAEKHTVYTGNYPLSAGAIVIPEKAEWRALNTKAHPDRILLVLEDNWGHNKGFWSVSSYLTRGEAIELAESLREAAASMENKEGEQSVDPSLKEFVQNMDQFPGPVGGIRAIMKLIAYPESAKNDRVEGTVHVVAYIDEKGTVVSTSIAKGVRKDLNKAAQHAVRQVRFSPGVMKGKPVKARITIPIRFKLAE